MSFDLTTKRLDRARPLRDQIYPMVRSLLLTGTIKPGEVISRVEAPRGELFYFIKSNGSELPERIKVRTPTLCNMASVLTLTVGHHLADVPMILVGIDPCFSCNDRGVTLRRAAGADYWDWERLRQFGIDYYAGKGTHHG